MNTVTVGKVTQLDNERLIVGGTVDGVPVSAEGNSGNVKNAKSEAHKRRYLEDLLLAAAPLKAGDAAVRGRFFTNVKIWCQIYWRVIALNAAISYAIFHWLK